jgi:hypothetical protein
LAEQQERGEAKGEEARREEEAGKRMAERVEGGKVTQLNSVPGPK